MIKLNFSLVCKMVLSYSYVWFWTAYWCCCMFRHCERLHSTCSLWGTWDAPSECWVPCWCFHLLPHNTYPDGLKMVRVLWSLTCSFELTGFVFVLTVQNLMFDKDWILFFNDAITMLSNSVMKSFIIESLFPRNISGGRYSGSISSFYLPQ